MRSSRPIGVARAAPGGRSGAESVRTAAVWIVERCLASRAPVDTFLGSVGEGFDERDQGLLRELVLGTLRWLRRLDDVIARASGRRLEQIQADLLPILRVGAYQLLFLDRVPPHAVVSEAVDQAHRRSHRAAASFVNAVLRRIARQPSLDAWPVEEASLGRRLALETSHPDHLVARWLERFGEVATRRLLAANNRPRPMHLLAFRANGGRELLAERLIDEGIEVEPSHWSPLGLIVRVGNPLRTESFRRGDFYVQDEVAQAAALVPRPRAGERVLDAAAAPGGKGLALLAAEPGVRLVAADLSLARLGLLRENLARLRLQVPSVAASAERPPWRAAFDRVVLDFPCSATGTLRKNPELKWRWSPGELARIAEQAYRLMVGAAGAVAPGGLLVAISCSLEPEENETLGERLLAERTELRRWTGGAGLELARFGDPIAAGAWRCLPDEDHDGFTVQVFERRTAAGGTARESRERLY